MEMYDSHYSPGHVLGGRIAEQMFEILPEGGPVVAIFDQAGNFWASDPERFADLAVSESFLKELQAKIDDGAEPVVTQVNECSIIGAQLATEQAHCGYVIIVLPQYSPESTLINIDLIEIVLNQVSLIARLIEKNSLLHELGVQNISRYGQITGGLN
ncbi:MAG: hypothetical protein ACYTBJ_07035 [Planctomycetota bacterium]|jgi:hypothetical protein